MPDFKQKFIDAARANYGSDDIEIDDNPDVSIGDDGVFVAAWVWVSNADVGIETCPL